MHKYKISHISHQNDTISLYQFHSIHTHLTQLLPLYDMYRSVARVLLMWKHFQAGGLEDALRLPMGPGRSPGRGPGGEAPGS